MVVLAFQIPPTAIIQVVQTTTLSNTKKSYGHLPTMAQSRNPTEMSSGILRLDAASTLRGCTEPITWAKALTTDLVGPILGDGNG
jgi:hypothetical protein